MKNIVGIVKRPQFDTNIFRPNQPIVVTDYRSGVEFNAVISRVEFSRMEVLFYNSNEDKPVFMYLDIEDFLNEDLEIKALVPMELGEYYNKFISPIGKTESIQLSECEDSVEDLLNEKIVNEYEEGEENTLALEETVTSEDKSLKESEDDKLGDELIVGE